MPGQRLAAGSVVTLVQANQRQSVVTAVIDRSVVSCDEPNLSMIEGHRYTLSGLSLTPEGASVWIALPGRIVSREIPGGQISLRLDERYPNVRVRLCTSSEGLHLTAWAGEPLKTRRLWHQYYYLGYDVEPSCTEEDFRDAVRGDMRRLPFRSACASAAVIMDAFGFFDTDEENESVLQEAARVLKADGRLALKVVNGRPILEAFRATAVQERDGVVISISRTLAIDPPRMTERISIKGPRGNGEYERRQRLYQVEELCAAVEHAGLCVLGVFASPDGGAFDASASPAIWLFGARGT